MPARLIGGDFDDSASEKFEINTAESFNHFFPEKIGSLFLNIFETATDGLADIIIKINSVHQLPIQFWFPKHYCFETIYRLRYKLKNLVNFSINSFSSYGQIQKSDGALNILLFNHFNMYNESLPAIIKDYRANGWITIEDFVHAPLDILKTKADYSVNSLRKLSDIEIAVCYSSILDYKLSTDPSDYYKIKKEAASLKNNFLKTGNIELEIRYLDLFKKAEAILDRKEIYLAYDKEVERAKRINWNTLLETRIKNYNYLFDSLSKELDIKLISGKYMYLIIKPRKRNELKKMMFENSIFPVIHWPDSADKIKDEILSIHIDQRYDVSDLERVYLKIKDFYRNYA